MRCHAHSHRDIVATCQSQGCGRGLCEECAGAYNIPLCTSCAQATIRHERSALRLFFAISVALFALGLALGVPQGVGAGILFGYFLAGVPWGWRALNRITPSVFLFMPIGGWVAYFVIKLVLSSWIGGFALPYYTYKSVRRWAELRGLDLERQRPVTAPPAPARAPSAPPPAPPPAGPLTPPMRVTPQRPAGDPATQNPARGNGLAPTGPPAGGPRTPVPPEPPHTTVRPAQEGAGAPSPKRGVFGDDVEGLGWTPVRNPAKAEGGPAAGATPQARPRGIFNDPSDEEATWPARRTPPPSTEAAVASASPPEPSPPPTLPRIDDPFDLLDSPA